MSDEAGSDYCSLDRRKRREHLSEEDLQKNKAILDSFSKGNPVGQLEGRQTHAHIYIHAQTNTQTHKQTHKHSHTNTNTRMHTHTYWGIAHFIAWVIFNFLYLILLLNYRLWFFIFCCQVLRRRRVSRFGGSRLFRPRRLASRGGSISPPPRELILF